MGCAANADKYRIRRMMPEDVERVRKIEVAIFSLPWSEKSFTDACTNPNNIYLVCEADGVIAGYCGMWTVMNEGNITNVAVDESYRRRGIARKMLTELHEEGMEKGIDTFFLEVRQSNTAAAALYRQLGYTEIGKRKNFYEKPVEDAVVLALYKM